MPRDRDEARTQAVEVFDDSGEAGTFGQYTWAFDYDVSNNPIYIAKAHRGNSNEADPVWQIRRLTYDASNNVTRIKWANGSANFDQVWNDRTTLTYS
jgi:YD repeat-containing protein